MKITKDKLGCKLPKELEHLSEFSQYAKKLKEDVYGFFIHQYNEDGTPNQAWWDFRTNTIGSSEVATLIDLDEYGDSVKLFWSKVCHKFKKFASKFTVTGLHFEEKVSDLWEYHDGTEEGWVDNWSSGEKVRVKEPIPCYAVNVNYPHISASMDFLVPGGQVSPFTGEVIEYDHPLEIKCVSQFASEKYELGIPHRYVAQCNLQMFVWGCDYAEIAYLVGGFDFKVLPLELDFELAQQIIEASYRFWEKVKQARDIYDGYDFLPEEEKIEIDKQISHIEPEPSGNEAYIEFYKDKYKYSYEETFRQGTEEEWEEAVRYNTLNDQIKELEKEKEKSKQKIMSFSQFDEVIDFGENGRILNKRREGKRNVFRVGIKNYK